MCSNRNIFFLRAWKHTGYAKSLLLFVLLCVIKQFKFQKIYDQDTSRAHNWIYYTSGCIYLFFVSKITKFIWLSSQIYLKLYSCREYVAIVPLCSTCRIYTVLCWCFHLNLNRIMHNMRADAYCIDGRASYILASDEDSDALPWVFVVQPHPIFPQTHTTSMVFLTQDRGREGWQLFHVGPVRRFVMPKHLGLKWTISPAE